LINIEKSRISYLYYSAKYGMNFQCNLYYFNRAKEKDETDKVILSLF